MRKSLLLSGWAILLGAHVGCDAPVEPRVHKATGFRKVDFDPFSITTISQRCKANERASVIVYGQGTSPMAIYVYDAHGNCVARDDLSLSMVSDDLAVEWRPPTDELYEVEIRNLGRKPNQAEVAIR